MCFCMGEQIRRAGGWRDENNPGVPPSHHGILIQPGRGGTSPDCGIRPKGSEPGQVRAGGRGWRRTGLRQLCVAKVWVGVGLVGSGRGPQPRGREISEERGVGQTGWSLLASERLLSDTARLPQVSAERGHRGRHISLHVTRAHSICISLSLSNYVFACGWVGGWVVRWASGDLGVCENTQLKEAPYSCSRHFFKKPRIC